MIGNENQQELLLTSLTKNCVFVCAKFVQKRFLHKQKQNHKKRLNLQWVNKCKLFHLILE